MAEYQTYKEDSLQWRDGVCIIFAGRANSKWQDPGILSTVPFSGDTFDTIARMFWVHSSIMRVINRSTDAHCSAEIGAWADKAPEATGTSDDHAFGLMLFGRSGLTSSQVYNCRSAASWDDDLALSATHIPERRFTFAVFYGCDAKRSAKLVERLQKSLKRVMHPMTLPLLFADVERDRHTKLIREYHTMLMQRACDFSNDSRRASEISEEPSSPSSSSVNEKPTEDLLRPERDSETMSQWMELYHLRNGLENWKAQLQKLADHQHELCYACPPSHGAQRNTSEQEVLRRCLAHQGTQIQARLQQLLLEYDEKIRQSSLIIDGMNFATQVEWNYIARKDIKTNLGIAESTMQTTNLTVEISKAAQRDSSHMRSIAVLTMAFLPGTFVACDNQDGLFYDFLRLAGQHREHPVTLHMDIRGGDLRFDCPDLGNMAVLGCFSGSACSQHSVWLVTLTTATFTSILLGFAVAISSSQSTPDLHATCNTKYDPAFWQRLAQLFVHLAVLMCLVSPAMRPHTRDRIRLPGGGLVLRRPGLQRADPSPLCGELRRGMLEPGLDRSPVHGVDRRRHAGGCGGAAGGRDCTVAEAVE
ncbi:hypothetical protein PG993_009538 [Apiospora rasikravindrae]|uniref:Uncharacterized protein n=1 Tax=Apiospora rasikravindrae TaxID=990691 RepID=A0ABR1SJP0_9PEZI